MNKKSLPFNNGLIDYDSISSEMKMAKDAISTIENTVHGCDYVQITPQTNEIRSAKATVPIETETIVEKKCGKYTCKAYNNGRVIGRAEVMPIISFVEILGETEENPRCVKVYFDDNTYERAVISKNDTFNLEQGISICITKKLLSMRCCGKGNAVYNKIVKDGLSVVANQYAQVELAKRLAEENEEKYQRRVEKKKRKAERRAEAERQKKEQEREEYIKTQVEIEVRAADEIFKKYGVKPVNVEDTDCND